MDRKMLLHNASPPQKTLRGPTEEVNIANSQILCVLSYLSKGTASNNLDKTANYWMEQLAANRCQVLIW